MPHCEYCNYSTDHAQYMDKHLKTKKHLENKSKIKRLNYENNKISKQNKSLANETEKYQLQIMNFESKLQECKTELSQCKNTIKNYEDEKIKYKSKKKKLKELIQKIKEDNDKNIQALIINKDREIELLLGQIQLLRENNTTLKEQSSVNNDCFKSSNKIVGKALDVITHITCTYKDAPALQPLNDYSLIFPNIQNAMKDVAYHGNKNMLDKYVGGIIMKEYIKEDPSTQSSWTTDYSRSTFTIKQVTWITDKGGIHMKDKIIKPILCYIRTMGHEYIEKEANTDDLEKMRELIDIREVMAKIDRDELADPINRYIAPYFCPGQNKLLMDVIKN